MKVSLSLKLAALLASMAHAMYAQNGLVDLVPVSSLSTEQDLLCKSIWRSPSLPAMQSESAFSNISVGYQSTRSDGICELQQGTGERSLLLCAQGVVHPKKETILYGKGYYAAGLLRDVAWRETSDYDRLRPYGLADDFVGSLTKRSYGFLGGWARTIVNTSIGLSGSYVSNAEYSQTDPRPLNISSKGELEASVALYSKLFNTTFCLDAGIELYNQANNVLFVSKKSGLFEYNMLGLGEYSQRFSGNKTDAVFRGIGGLIGVETLTKHSLRTSTFIMVRNTQWILMNINSLPLAQLKSFSISHHAIYSISTGTTLDFRGKVQIKQGVEGIFGAGVDVAYPKLGEEKTFHEVAYDTQVSLLHQWHLGRYLLACMPTVMVKGKKESYTLKEKEYSIHNLYPSWSIRFEKECKQWWFALETTAGACFNINKALAGFGKDDVPITNMVYTNFTQQARSFPFANMRIMANCTIGKLKYFGNVESRIYKVDGRRMQLSYGLSCGVEL